MPRLENIERFKEILYNLGSEPQVNAQRAEAREDDAPPEGSAEDQGGADFGLDTASVAGEDLGLEGEALPALGLDDLLGEGHEAAPPADEAEAPAAPVPEESEHLFDADSGGEPAGAGELDGLDIGDLLGETVDHGPSEEATPAADNEPSGEEPAEEDLGLANGFFMPDLGLEGQPEEEAASGEEAPAVPPGGEEREADPAELSEGGSAGFDPFAVDFDSLDAPEEPATADAPPGEDSLGAPGAVPDAADLRDATVDGESAPSSEMETFDTSGLGSEELPGPVDDADIGAEGGLESSIDELADGFSLEGLSDSAAEDAIPGEGPEGSEAGASGEEPASAPAEGGTPVPAELSLEDREFRAIQRNLAGLPRNLKIAIEALIGEQGYAGEGLPLLLDMLARGASPRDIGAQLTKLTGRTIRIPVRYERQTGEAFEEAQLSPAYLFRKNVLPILRTIVLIGGLLGVLAFGGYRFVYLPLHARSLYRAGYSALEQQRYAESVRTFDKATEVRQVKSWYYRYAEGYAARKEYRLADGVYAKFQTVFGYEKKELLDRARLKSQKLAEYAEAEKLLNVITDKDYHDADAVLAHGDNYLEWARSAPLRAREEGELTRGDLLERARVSFAHLLERYGYKNEVLFRMMRYFVMKDLPAEIQDLRDYFEADAEFKPDPAVYAELGGYLLDKGDIDGARTVLFKATARSSEIPETDYHLARLFRILDEPAEEGKALRNALLSLAKADRTPERILMAIDAHRRTGDWYYRAERYLDARKEYQTAIEQIEEEQDAGTLGRMPDLGLAYEGLGNVDYYVEGDYASALALYERARANGITDPNLDYRIGYIHYSGGNYASAIRELVPVQEREPQNWNALFALATALHQRREYFAAEGYYRRLLDRLLDKRNAIPVLRPEANPDHLRLLNLLIRTRNNLGVTYYRETQAGGAARRNVTRAMVEITEATQYADILARDPETLERSGAKNLPYLNAAGILQPTVGFDPTIYDRLPKDLEADRF